MPAPIVELADGTKVAERAFLQACRDSPNRFIEYVLDLEQAPLHEEMQAHYSDNNECGIGISRGHGKTTQTLGRVAWEIGRSLCKDSPDYDPSVRWKYVQAKDKEAGKSVNTTRVILESPRFNQVFPGLIPDQSVWGKSAFQFKTEAIQRDPTMEACTIFGHAGGRATSFVFDDICDEVNAIQRPALRDKVIEAYANTWRPMLTGDRRRVWKVFTPWHEADITAMWIKSQCGKSPPQPGVTGNLLWRPCIGTDSSWPAEWTPERLAYERVEMGPIAYSRAYELKPMDPSQLIWPAEWMERSMYIDIPARSSQGYRAMTIDFAWTEKELSKPDPDWSIALVAHIDHHGHAWLLDMLRVRTQFPAFSTMLKSLISQWGITRATAEATGGQRMGIQQLNNDLPCPVEAVNRVSDKTLRAIPLQSFAESGRFHIQGTDDGEPIASLRELWNEMVIFPGGRHDDTVDAAMDMMQLAMQGGGSMPVNRITEDDGGVESMYR